MINSPIHPHFAKLRRLGVLFLCLFLAGAPWRLAGAALAVEQGDTRLWYSQPAKVWNDALPIGNGRMGAMVFGGIVDERIQFNEDTLPHLLRFACDRTGHAGGPTMLIGRAVASDPVKRSGMH